MAVDYLFVKHVNIINHLFLRGLNEDGSLGLAGASSLCTQVRGVKKYTFVQGGGQFSRFLRTC